MNVIIPNISGPFGHYPWGTIGAVLNCLVRNEKVPVSTVERFQVDNEKIFDHNGSVRVAQYRWFEGIDYPLFMWVHPDFRIFNKQRFLVSEDKTLKPEFRLQLTCHLTPGFQIDGPEATVKMHEFLHGMCTNWIDDPRYKLNKNASGFFQGGSDKPDGEWFLFEFWRPEGAQAWIDYVNENYYPAEVKT